jgi:hypothetical protein
MSITKGNSALYFKSITYRCQTEPVEAFPDSFAITSYYYDNRVKALGHAQKLPGILCSSLYQNSFYI